MRYLWVDANNDPDWEKVAGAAINGLYFDIRDARLDRAYFDEVRDRGYVAGVYAAASPNWPELWSTSGAEHAELVSARLEDIAPRTGRSHPKVQFDIELHDPEYVLDCLTRWRQLRPTRDTSWTLEPFQGGWMSAEFVAAISGLGVRVVPQYYFGPSDGLPDMRPAAQDVVKDDLVARGFPRQLVSGFYDAATLPGGWDGFAFTMGRLP